ncbi:MAG: helix-turn-helix domain-containing protein [Geminicoccaceae bacterium]
MSGVDTCLLRPVDIAATRRCLGLSHTEFAAWFGISPGTLRNWEQGHRVPEGPARVLLRVIEGEPEAVRSGERNEPRPG